MSKNDTKFMFDYGVAVAKVGGMDKVDGKDTDPTSLLRTAMLAFKAGVMELPEVNPTLMEALVYIEDAHYFLTGGYYMGVRGV